MKNFGLMYLFIPVFLLLSGQVAFSQKIEPTAVDKYINQLMKDFEVPALSVAIVSEGDVVYNKAFGTKTIGRKEAVDQNTLFAIGSISKSITALSLGILVDEGKINWDDKVKDYLPYFEMYDPAVTNAYTIRDLLIHKSGLPPISGGTLWYGSDLTREQVLRQMKHLRPVSEFRTSPAYQNLTFVAGGEIVAAVTGKPWDDFVKERIFEPLNMKNTFSRYKDITSYPNISTPHTKDRNLNIIPIPHRNHDNIGPAGAIYSTATDMAQYMKLILNEGVFGKDTIVSPKVMAEILKPHTFFPIFQEPIHNEFSAYAFGWWITPKNGHKVVEHSGGVDGMVANLEMVTDKKFGIIALSNTEESAAVALTLHMLGVVLNDESYNAYEKARREARVARKNNLKENQKKVADSRLKGTKPTLDLQQYVGAYEEEMYGDILITLVDKKLNLNFSHTPSFEAKLNHWHHNTFELDWKDPMVPKGFVTFILNAKGEVTELRFEQPNMLDVDFKELGVIRKKS